MNLSEISEAEDGALHSNGKVSVKALHTLVPKLLPLQL